MGDMHRFSANFATPRADFIWFVLRFGWEGPALLAIGLLRHAVTLTVIGALVTLVAWVFVGGPISLAALRSLLPGADD